MPTQTAEPFLVIIFHCLLRTIFVPYKDLKVALEIAEVLGVVASGIRRRDGRLCKESRLF
jgi:hypothetical protein